MRIKSPPVQECTDVTAGVEKLLSLLLKFEAVTVGNCLTKRKPVITFSLSISGTWGGMCGIPFLLTFCPIHLHAAIFTSALTETAECTIAVSGNKRRARINERCNMTIQFILIYITILQILSWFGLSLMLNFNVCTGSSSISAALRQKKSEGSWTSPWFSIC